MTNRLDKAALQRIASTIISYAGIVLFFWAIYPYKWMRWLVWYARKDQAIAEARYRARTEGKAQYVIQNKMRFEVRSRAEARRIDTKIHRNLKERYQSHIRWDYRNGLVFVAYPDGSTETIDATPRTTRREAEKGEEQ